MNISEKQYSVQTSLDIERACPPTQINGAPQSQTWPWHSPDFSSFCFTSQGPFSIRLVHYLSLKDTAKSTTWSVNL